MRGTIQSTGGFEYTDGFSSLGGANQNYGSGTSLVTLEDAPKNTAKPDSGYLLDIDSSGASEYWVEHDLITNMYAPQGMYGSAPSSFTLDVSVEVSSSRCVVTLQLTPADGNTVTAAGY